jgi:hypothetical protein
VILCSSSAMAIAYEGVARRMGWPMGAWFVWKAPLCGIAGFLASIALAFMRTGLASALLVALVSVLMITPLVMRFARVWSQPVALFGMAFGGLWIVLGLMTGR